MSSEARSNIVFLFSDQHRRDTMSCAGHPVVRTPAMDRLAREGVRFANAYCPTPLCIPCRVSLLTGRYSRSTGIIENAGEVLPEEPTFPQHLRQAGYHTCFTGKLHLAQGAAVGSAQCQERLGQMGFDNAMPVVGKACAFIGDSDCVYRRFLKEHGVYNEAAEDYLGRLLGRGAGVLAKPFAGGEQYFQDIFISRISNEWLSSYDGEKPFFLWCNWGGPHPPWDAPGHYAKLYDPADVDVPVSDPMERAPQSLRETSRSLSSSLTEEQWRGCRALYYGNVNVVDDGIATMLDTLEARGLLDNTLVIYASDHGEMLFDHGLRGKSKMYEASAGVPLIVRWPERFPQGVVTDALASTLDLVPLMLETAGAEPLPVGHGVSPLPVLTGEAEAHRECVFSEMSAKKMVRRGNWKYVCAPAWETPQLFNLEDDPDELDNLAGLPEAADVEAGLARDLLRWLTTTEVRPNSGQTNAAKKWPDLMARARAAYQQVTGRTWSDAAS